MVARIGIYGGSFDPPHIGHKQASDYAIKALSLQSLYVVPSNATPGKEYAQERPTAQQRLDMVTLAMKHEAVRVWDAELSRGGISYTVDTVRQFRIAFPEDELVLFMGTDMFLSFLNWRSPEEIMKMASVAVFYRGEHEEKNAISRQKDALEKMGATVYVVENPVVEISSTDLRRMLVLQCADDYLAPDVLRYISENGLYGTGKDYRQLSEDDLEAAVVSLLKPSRVAHVRGCRQEAVKLAQFWGADETAAARAALLHDVTKALDGPLQVALCKCYGVELDDFFRQNPKTLHALTGSLVAKRIFGESEAVVDAICSHTTGKANMNLLEKIIYVADYMEPNRNFPGVEELRILAYSNIDAALQRGLEMTLDMLHRQGRQISPQSEEALRYLQGNG